MPQFTTFSEASDGVATDFHDPRNRNLLDRWQPVADWISARSGERGNPRAKAAIGRIGARVTGFDGAGHIVGGVNFASQDCLNLGSHPAVLSAVHGAATRFGVHSAGSADHMGLSALTLDLEERIAAFLNTEDATVFPTGWTAGFEVMRTLVQDGDHILIDARCHAGLQETARCATRKVSRIRHCSIEAMARRLEDIRTQEPDAGILVVTEALFATEGTSPDIAAIQALCWRHEATLLLDVSNDLGARGPRGRGIAAEQGVFGRIDVVTGSLAHTFAANGGFVASDHPALKSALRMGGGPQSFTSAISPLHAAAAIAALNVIEGAEGEKRRSQLIANCRAVRGALEARGFEVLGADPGPVIPVRLGNSLHARRMTAAMVAAGVMVNLLDHPAVPRNGARWLLLAMADHRPADIDALVSTAAQVHAQLVR